MPTAELKPVGYAALADRFGVKALPHFCRSVIAQRGQRRQLPDSRQLTQVYTKQYDPGDGIGAQLEFALKYEGVNLEILARLFERIDPQELKIFIQSKPKGRYARVLWHLFELLTGKALDLADLPASIPYVDLLDEAQYFTADKRPSRRHKVNDNLPGNLLFSPMIRRTPRLEEFIDARLDERCREVLRQFPEDVLHRALDYLFTKETRSSFEIEHIRPDSGRTARFVELLKRAGSERYLNKEALVGLQRATVDERFANPDWRTDQNYVGAAGVTGQENVHYIPPKPEDVGSMMEGLLESAHRMLEAQVPPVLVPSPVAFRFVFVHPFDDGNGRLHRFLIHHILAKTGFTPEGVIFPVSATMVRQRAKYDALLEAFSRPLLPLVEYKLDGQGRMTVFNDTAVHYRYPDLTRIAEGLFEFIQETIETELPAELRFLVSYDQAKRAMQEIVDMPDRLIDLFIRVCRQNQGRLSKAKRESLFPMLTDGEVEKMEAAFREAFH